MVSLKDKIFGKDRTEREVAKATPKKKTVKAVKRSKVTKSKKK